MVLTKNETNNAIVVRLENVRKHPNADRLKLATVLGTTVVVGLDAKDGDVVIYFDSNLRLSDAYLKSNNLYSNKELNTDTSKKGYFGSNGRVRAQKFRGEMSNGYVAEPYTVLSALGMVEIDSAILEETFTPGVEFTHVNDVEICSKYIVQHGTPGQPGSRNRSKKTRRPASAMFHEHWDTHQLMRCYHNIPRGAVLYIEEKIHGTSGRTGHLMVHTNRPWYKPWIPKQKWAPISGTRRLDHIGSHMPVERKEIEDMLAPKLHKGETVYFEIFGYEKSGAMIQTGFPYGCKPGEYKVMLYRVTITTPDNFSYDLSREAVYHRADELGLLKPVVLNALMVDTDMEGPPAAMICDQYIHGNSAWDNHMKEGVVVWYQEIDGTWNCLKAKSDEFYEFEDGLREKGVGDVEDVQ